MRREGFDKERDRLFSVGDLLDRGPNSEECMALLDEPWFFTVLGNHEYMMINALKNSDEFDKWCVEFGRWARWVEASRLDEWLSKLVDIPISLTLNSGGYSVGICHAEPDGQNWT